MALAIVGLDTTKEPDVLKHIVMWKLKDHAEGADRATNATRLKAMLEGCRDIVPGIRRFEVGVATPGLEATYDVVLVSDTRKSRHLSPACATRGNASIMKPDAAREPAERPITEQALGSPFVDHLGMRVVHAGDGHSEVALPLAALHLNTWDVAHGGVTMTLLDVGLALAARSLGSGTGVVTVEMKTNFMQPGRGELRARARVLHRSPTMAYCEGEVHDSEGRFVAKALGTFKYLSALAILLVSRPAGEPSHDNFRLVQTPLEPLAQGQVRVRNHYLSLDPYMRGRMNDTKSYAPPQPLDEVMLGGTVGEVVESKHPQWRVGDKVLAMFGWQEYGTSDGTGMQKVNDSRVPLSACLGPVGMPGVTAWYGLNRIIAPKPGSTVVVSAASGAVGSVVGQLAKLGGARAVGIAGGADKCRYVVDTLGFDACVDYKAGELYRDLKRATPAGVDGCFENVGGEVLDATLARMNPFGRIALCGMIAGYNGKPAPLKHPALILTQRLRVEGFIVLEHMEVWPQALRELGTLVATQRLQYRESIAQGLDSAVDAFIGLLKGHNFGKQLVKLV
ncbi:hypothetical protein DFQ30_010580 [Apophysomyces sp. BC1015]|nr:hypothetical protein DFQ30_010580 [Apophysomyces sp. BC1015]